MYHYVFFIFSHCLMFVSWTEERLEKRNRRRAKPREYHRKVIGADGVRKWQGGRDLAASAEYPYWFCRAVHKSWTAQVRADGVL